MPVNTTRSEYDIQQQDWQKIRDCISGESAVKAQGEQYLPAPPGLKSKFKRASDGELPVFSGNDRYAFYASFAEFPEIVSPALNGLQGMIHAKPPEFILPESMEYLREAATPDGDSLEELWELVTRETLSVGRVGLLAEVSESVEDQLQLCAYVAESLINWRQRPKIQGGGLTLAILEEHESRDDMKDPYRLVRFKRWRELLIDPSTGNYTVRLWEESENENEPVLLADETGETDTVPVLRGRAFGEIPLTVINAIDRGLEFGPSPCLPMVRRALSIYRKTADYFRALYIKGDPQVVITGVDEGEVPTQIGGGAIWAFNHSEAKAYYLDIDGQGIPLQRDSILDEYERFAAEAGRLTQSADGNQAESGEAIRRRQSMQQVTLKSLVINAAEGLQQALRQIARLLELPATDVDSIDVKPNLDFTEVAMTTREMLDLIMAKNQGLKISHHTINEILRRRGVPLQDDDTENERIADEGPDLGLVGAGAGTAASANPDTTATVTADATGESEADA